MSRFYYTKDCYICWSSSRLFFWKAIINYANQCKK